MTYLAIAYHYFLFWSLIFVDAAPEDICVKCACGSSLYLGQMMYVVNCTNAGISTGNVDILEQLDEKTEVFVLNGNQLPELPVNIFGSMKNLTHLRVIDMTNNSIEEIRGKTFHHVPVVERLILNHNSLNLSSKPHPRVFSNFDSLRELHLTNAFMDDQSADLAEQLHTIFSNSNLNQLHKLHLEQNEIQSFADRKVFCDLVNLTDLYLGNNDLKELNFEIECLPRLRFIDLEANKIERFSKEDLTALDSFPKKNHTLTIDIHQNPLICDCAVNNLYVWLKRTRVVVRNNNTVQCHYSRSGNDSIFLINYSELDCSTISKAFVGISNESVEHKIVHYIFTTMSVILLLGLIYLCAKYSLAYCRHVVTPTSKVHYIVIRNPDENREVHV